MRMQASDGMAELEQGVKRLIQLRPKDWLADLFGAFATYLGTAPTDKD